jgi:hypothetical protein
METIGAEKLATYVTDLQEKLKIKQTDYLTIVGLY